MHDPLKAAPSLDSPPTIEVQDSAAGLGVFTCGSRPLRLQQITGLAWVAACALTLFACSNGSDDEPRDVSVDESFYFDVDATTEDTAVEDANPEDADGATLRECNGHAELCDRPFNEVSFPTTHNSMSNDEEGWIAPNHLYPIEWQLESGIRAMLLDVYDEDDELVLCHSVCTLGSRDFVEALTAIRVFLEDNEDDVFTFIIQNAVSSAQIEQAFDDSGLLPMVYTYEGGDWPTIGEMAASGARVLVTVESGGAPPVWVHHAWDVMSDTPYSFETADDFNCDVNRGSAEHSLFLMNHWISNPLSQESNAEIANTYEELGGRASACREERGQIPNFVAVDFSSIGALYQVVDELNGL